MRNLERTNDARLIVSAHEPNVIFIGVRDSEAPYRVP